MTHDIERALLGAIMRDGDNFEQVRDIVKPDSFSNHALRNAWQACENLHERGDGIDTITVGDELERMGAMNNFVIGDKVGRNLLGWLRGEGDPGNVVSYAEAVQDYSTKRTLDSFFTQCVVWSKNGRRANDIMRDVENELSKITVYSANDEFTVPIGVGVSEAYDWTDRAAKGEVVGVPTGFIDVEKVIGSMIAGNVYIVAGRPGDGKTAFLLSVARNVAKSGKRVGIFSLEMSRMQVAQRLIAMEGGLDLQNTIQGKMKEMDWPVYTHAVEQVEALPIVINDLSSINIYQIRQTARKIKASGGLDLILVDYIQLAESGEKHRERRELDVSAVSRGLKYLARELNVPILAAAQLSRAVEQRAGNRPILSDLRESGSLEQDAYCVMFLYRSKEAGKENVTEIIVAKHRNGKTGSVDLIWRDTLAKFENAVTRMFRPNTEEV